MTARARLVGLVLGGMVAVTGPHARAQDATDTDRKATATALFHAGRELVAEDRAAEACPKFEESYRLFEANGTLINLADCYEQIGKTASAWLTFREVAQKSRRDGQDARADVADDRAHELERRLTKLLVRVGPNAGVAGLVVERDGVELGRAALDVPVPVDPGPHRIAARAPGHAPWETTVRAEGEGATVELSLPALMPSGAPVPLPADEAPTEPRPWQAPMGIALFALGGAGVVAGVALGGAAKAKADGAECSDDDRCTPAGLETRNEAVTLGNVGTGIGIAGAVLGGLGITLWLTAPGDDPEPAVSLGIGAGGVSARGSF